MSRQQMQELNVKLTTDISQLSQGMKKAQASISSLKTGIMAVGGAIGAYKIIGWGKELADDADRMAKLGTATGTTVKELEKLRLAGEYSGVSFDQNIAALRRYQKTVGEALRGGIDAEPFEDLGLDPAKLATGDVAAGFAEIGNALEKYNTTAQKAAVLNKIFGRSGMALITQFENGGKAFKDAARSIDSMGLAFDNSKIEEMNDRIGEFQTKIRLISTSILSDLAPALTKWAEGLSVVSNMMSKIETPKDAEGESLGVYGWLTQTYKPIQSGIKTQSPIEEIESTAMENYQAKMRELHRAMQDGRMTLAEYKEGIEQVRDRLESVHMSPIQKSIRDLQNDLHSGKISIKEYAVSLNRAFVTSGVSANNLSDAMQKIKGAPSYIEMRISDLDKRLKEGSISAEKYEREINKMKFAAKEFGDVVKNLTPEQISDNKKMEALERQQEAARIALQGFAEEINAKTIPVIGQMEDELSQLGDSFKEGFLDSGVYAEATTERVKKLLDAISKDIVSATPIDKYGQQLQGLDKELQAGNISFATFAASAMEAQKQLDKIELERLVSDAKSLTDALKTPADTMAAGLQDLQQMLSKGLIPEDLGKGALGEIVTGGTSALDALKTPLDELTEKSARIKKMMADGLIPDDLGIQAIRAIGKEIDNIELARLTDEAKSLTDALKTPLDAMASGLQDLQQMLERGLLPDDAGTDAVVNITTGGTSALDALKTPLDELTEKSARIKEMMADGLIPDDLGIQAIRAIGKEIDNIELARLTDEAKSLTDALKTPLDAMESGLQDLQQMLERGLLPDDVGGDAINKITTGGVSALDSLVTPIDALYNKIYRVQEMMADGLIPEDLGQSAIANLSKEIDNIELAKLISDAESITNALKTPADTMAAGLQDLQKMLERGLLPDDLGKGALDEIVTGGTSALDALKTPMDDVAEKMMRVREMMEGGLIPEDLGQSALQRLGAEMEALSPQFQAMMDYTSGLQSEAASLFESTRTPMEKSQAEIGKLKDMLNAGMIDVDTFSRGMSGIMDEMGGDKKKNVFAGETTASNISGLMAASAIGGTSDVEKQQLGVLKEIRQAILGQKSNTVGIYA